MGFQPRKTVAAWLLAVSLAAGQDVLPPPKPLLDSGAPSQVFPEGGFPDGKPAPEGDVPASERKPVYSPLLHSAGSDYPEPEDPQQEGPAAAYYRFPTLPLPDYVYQPAYFQIPVTSPRSIIEYAPPGYETRDQQVTPDIPEFTPITPPPRLTPEEQAKFVTRGLMPGSFLVPATNTSFRFRGFVRFTGLYDLDPIGTADIFVPNSIPVPQTDGENFNLSARASRIALETWTPTAFKEWNVHTFVEADFFNGPAQAAGGGGNPFRLRHAFIDFGYFRVGQQNTVFMDATTWPSVVDFQGPAGWANLRRTAGRATIPLSDLWFWAIGIEQPFSDITTFGLGDNVQDVPDFTSHIRYEGNLGHFQVSGLLRSVSYRPIGGEPTRRTAAGVSAGTTFHPWAWLIGSDSTRKANPTALERCRLIGQYTAGHGIARYLNDTIGLGLDGVVDPATGSFDLPYVSGCIASYEHWLTEHWLANLVYSQTLVGSTAGQPGSTYAGAKYTAVTLWYIPFRGLSVGIEYLWGERENLDGERGRANRINGLAQYNF